MTEQYLRERLPITYEKFGEWLDWADKLGFLLRVYPNEQKQELRAAAVVRPIRKDQLEEYDAFVYDEDGEILYIDICAIEDAKAMRGLGFAILERFGPRSAIAFNSHRRGVRVHDFAKARKSLFYGFTKLS